MRRRKGTKLPKLTVLAYSAQELLRFSQAAEHVATCSATLGLVVDQATRALARIEAVAAELEKRSSAARKANATRRAPPIGADQAAAELDGLATAAAEMMMPPDGRVTPP